tara:strand:+ start:610 stop:771 length:162 start_codon:yes stop_codon:yes gene_type:complete
MLTRKKLKQVAPGLLKRLEDAYGRFSKHNSGDSEAAKDKVRNAEEFVREIRVS